MSKLREEEALRERHRSHIGGRGKEPERMIGGER